ALVGVAAQCHMAGARIDHLDVVSFGTGPVPQISEQSVQAAAGQSPTGELARELAVLVAGEIDPDTVPNIEIKRRQAEAIARRVLIQMFQECAHASQE